jgi:hypothetical protein
MLSFALYSSIILGLTLKQSGHLAAYLSVEHFTKAPPNNPNPSNVGMMSIITATPQSEHFPLKVIVDVPGNASNNGHQSFTIKSPAQNR